MTVAQKAVLSFALSALLVGGIAALAYTGVLDLIEEHFYNPSVSEALIREASRDARLLGEYLSGLQDRFSLLLSIQAVRRSFLPGQNAQDVYERSRLFGELLESVPSLHSVRFIDSAGSRIHFSTHPADVAHSDLFSITYKGYNEDPTNLPFNEVLTHDRERLILDNARGRIIFSFPFHDSDAYRGVALFTISTRALSEVFAVAGKKGVGENMVLVADPGGFIDVVPGISSEAILPGVTAIWAAGYRSIVPFVTSTSTLALVSVPMDQGLYFGRVVNEAALHFPQPAKNLVVTMIFLTLFLIIFFLLNFKQGSQVETRDDSVDGEAKKSSAGTSTADEELEELEVVGETPGRGLLAAAALSNASATAKTPATANKTKRSDGIDSTVRRMPDLEEIETIDADNAPVGDYAELEVVSPFASMFSSLGELEDIPGGVVDSAIVQPFTVQPGDPKPLPQAESGKPAASGEVIVEQDGIPYINSTAVGDDGSAENIDNNFIKLVKAVTDNTQGT